ncbi:MAG: MCE family protein [Bacteroidales bacterium]|nr:MCE family protein [Bacteroidales bacterium]
MNESSNKRFIIVGLFIFIGLLILTGGVFLVGNLRKTFEKRIELTTVFNDVAGLQVGNNVWLSGVKVGTVSDLAFYGKYKVKVRIMIEEKAKQFIPVDAQVKISSDGFIGNKILVIFGGTNYSQNVKGGDTLAAYETFTNEEVFNTLQENNKNLLSITNNLKTLIFKLLSGEGTIGKLLNDNAVYENFQSATASLAGALDNTHKMTETLVKFSAKLNQKGTLANELINDTVTFNAIRISIVKLQQVADSTSVLISNLKQDQENPNSTLGILLKDKQSGENLKETIKNLQTSSQKLDENLEAMKHSIFLKGYFKKKERSEKK